MGKQSAKVYERCFIEYMYFCKNKKNSMKNKTNVAVIIVLSISFLLSGCIKPGDCERPETPLASSNTPVMAGRYIQLKTPWVGGASYEWKGPNGFTSDDYEPIIRKTTYASAGTYSVTVTVDECTSNPGITDVVIDTVMAPCNPANNTGVYVGLPTLNFYGVGGRVENGHYVVDANSSNGDLYFEFGPSTVPEEGVYTISSCYSSGYRQSHEVCVKTLVGSIMHYWYYPSSGEVFVLNNNGKLTISFCDVEFAGGDPYLKFKGSVKVTTK
jgi:hypothetical protein